MHTTMCDPVVRRNKPHWLNTVGLTIAALVFGSAATVTAQGAAISPPPDLSPVIRAELLVPSHVPPPITRRAPAKVVVELETIEKRAPLTDSVEYEFWTFNGSVPGPFLQVRVRDTIELHLKNAHDSEFPHSINLHAVTGPHGGAMLTQTAPNQTTTFQWQALNPGLYVYHCATALAPHHVASGMYGLILVEPEDGLPPVDRGFPPFSMEKLLAERPEYIVFYGAVGALMAPQALRANVVEKVRIFFGVGGPNITSSFHVIGEIFDTVYPQGASEARHHLQTTLVPAGGATTVELTFQVPGTYLLVDHSLSHVVKEAVGTVAVEGPEAPDIYGKLPGM
jgi:nitrite reductase (NO-forming)